jgi:hypothetical protein
LRACSSSTSHPENAVQQGIQGDRGQTGNDGQQGPAGATLIAALLQDGFETLDAPRNSSRLDETPIRASDCLNDEPPSRRPAGMVSALVTQTVELT